MNVHSPVIEALARRFELRFDSLGLADKIAGNLANAAAGLEVQVHGGSVSVSDLGPVWSEMLMAHEHAIGELEAVCDS